MTQKQYLREELEGKPGIKRSRYNFITRKS
jgi:hypothetical protein